MRRRRFIGFALLVARIATSHSLPVARAQNMLFHGPGTYTDAQYGFSLSLPTDWSQAEDDSRLPDKPFSIVTFTGPPVTGGRIDIVATRAPVEATLDGLGQDGADRQQLLPYVTEIIGIQNAPTLIGSVDARWFEYLGQSRSGMRLVGPPFHTVRVLTLAQGLVMTLTVTLSVAAWNAEPSIPQGFVDTWMLTP